MFNKKESNKIDYKAVNSFFTNFNIFLNLAIVLVIVLAVLLVTYLIKEWNILSIFKTVLAVISPVFIGFIVAWLLDPLVTKFSSKMPRVFACILTYVIVFGSIIAMLVLIVPTFSSGIKDIISVIPKVVDTCQNFAGDLIGKFGDSSQIASYKDSLFSKIEETGMNLVNTLPDLAINSLKGFISGASNIILGLMIGFYLLFDFRKFQGHILSIMPLRFRDGALDLMKRINGKLRSYVVGVLIIMLLVFITQSIAFSLSGLNAPFLFAFFCAITDIIPYIGPWIGGAPAVIVGMTISPTVGVFCLISILICQLLENNFYQPLIMGKTMKLHPVTIMLGLLIFNYFFGMIGMIVATPFIATLKIIIGFTLERTSFLEKFNNYQENNKKTVKEKSTKNNHLKES